MLQNIARCIQKASNSWSWSTVGQMFALRKIPSSDAGLNRCAFNQDGLKRCVHQVNVRDSRTRSNVWWKCGGLDHFQKDCKDTLNFQGGDRDDLAVTDTNPTIGQMRHTMTTSIPITDLTFKAILKEMVSLTNHNRKTFHPKPQSTLKNISETSTSGAGLSATPVMTMVTSTSLAQSASQLAPYTICPGSTSLPVNPGRGLPQTRN